MKRFPHYLQFDAMDCGPTCLRMIAKYYGKSYSLQTLRDLSYITREGVSMLGISDAAESIGFSYFRCTYIIQATSRRCSIALHFALELKSFCCLLRYSKE